jgi:hypothetical protein
MSQKLIGSISTHDYIKNLLNFENTLLNLLNNPTFTKIFKNNFLINLFKSVRYLFEIIQPYVDNTNLSFTRFFKYKNINHFSF